MDREYASVGVDALRWSQMTHAQRLAYAKKVLGGGIVDDKCDNEAVLKKLSLSITESGLAKQLATQVLADIWKKAEVILSQLKVIPLKDNFCVTESDKAFTVESKKGKLLCNNCPTSVATGGLCQHSVAVAETQGTLKQHDIQHYREQNDLESRLAFDNAPKGAASKQCQKKPRRGQNNVEQQLILAEVDPNAVIDPELDVPKHCHFMEVHHNDKPFCILFVKDFKATACEQCKVNFSRTLPIAPWDICILHKERYLYPVKDPNDYQILQFLTVNSFPIVTLAESDNTPQKRIVLRVIKVTS